MMKYIALFVTLALSGPTWASKGTIINHSNKDSPASVIAKTFESAVGADKIDFFQAGNCQEAEKKFQSTNPAVMIYNADVGIAARAKNMQCPFVATPENTIFVGKSYLRICTNSKNPKDFTNARTIGAASVIMSPGLIADYNSNGLNLRGVPYGGSRSVLAALISGDIDMGFVAAGIADPAMAANQIVCPYITDPRKPNFIGNKFNLKIPTLPIVKVFYTNSKDPVFRVELEKALQNPLFQEYLKKSGYDDVKYRGITSGDIAEVQKHIKDSVDFYWK